MFACMGCMQVYFPLMQGVQIGRRSEAVEDRDQPSLTLRDIFNC